MRRKLSSWSVRRLYSGVHTPRCRILVHFTTNFSTSRHNAYAFYQQATAMRDESMVQVRPFSSLATNEENDNEDDFIQAYEDLLLNASAQAEAGAPLDGDRKQNEPSSPDPNTTNDTHLSFPLYTAPSSSLVDSLVEEALAILPADGAALQLTDLTPLLDLEVISEHFGSARAFFQLYPHHFTCVQDARTKRWRVARVAAPASTKAVGEPAPPCKVLTPQEESAPSSSSHAELDVAEVALNDELTYLHAHPISTSPSTVPSVTAGLNSAQKKQKKRMHVLMPTHAAVKLPWNTVATLLPEDGTPLPIAQLRSQLPSDITKTLHANQMGLARCFKQDYDDAHKFVALSLDCAFLMRSAGNKADSTTPVALHSGLQVSLWTPPSTTDAVITQHVSSVTTNCGSKGVVLGDGVYVPIPADASDPYTKDAAEAWWVDVPLEDTEEMEEGTFSKDGAEEASPAPKRTQQSIGPLEAAALETRDDGSALDAATGLEEVPYDGLLGAHKYSSNSSVISDASLLVGFDLELLRHAPAAPAPPVPTSKLPDRPASSDASIAGVAKDGSARTKKKLRMPRPTTLEEWIALHTSLANAHGWLTPPEMLDYLVECVPTFFVPLEEVRTSDALLSLVGPRTSMQTLLTRIYMYYVEISEDGTRVRLAATVEHLQRGAANVHYEAWDPTTTWKATGTAQDWLNPHDSEGNAKGAPAPFTSSFSKLKSSEATRAFPVLHVLRPIKSALPAKLPRRKTQGGAPSTSSASLSTPSSATMKDVVSACATALSTTIRGNTVTVKTDDVTPIRRLFTVSGQSSSNSSTRSSGGGVSLSSIPVSDIGYPYLALATQPVESWPWWARLLCVLPFTSYIPLEDVGTRYFPGLPIEELKVVWKASASSVVAQSGTKASTHPFPYALLRPPPEGGRQVRLRPFWLAPGCTAELDSSVLPADLAKQLRPVWMPLPRVLEKLNPVTRASVMTLALRRMPGAKCTPEEALLCLLRDCGRCCWVNEEGTKVRCYAASQEMDDFFHFALSFLHGFGSALAWEAVPKVLERAARHVQPLFDITQAAGLRDTPYDVGLLGMLHRTPTADLHQYLKRHAQWIDVKLSPSSSFQTTKSASEPELLIRRRAAFVSFTKER